MTALRQRMLEDMKIRNLALNTQDSYLRQVSQFARHFGRSPDLLGQEEIRSYQIYRSISFKRRSSLPVLSPLPYPLSVSSIR
jgi:hypothetical protein